MSDPKAVVGRYNAAWVARDLDGFMDCIAEDSVQHTPGAPPRQERANLRSGAAEYMAAFPEETMDVHR